jgi:hypothetical protein
MAGVGQQLDPRFFRILTVACGLKSAKAAGQLRKMRMWAITSAA